MASVPQAVANVVSGVALIAVNQNYARMMEHAALIKSGARTGRSIYPCASQNPPRTALKVLLAKKKDCVPTAKKRTGAYD
tara:strand:- start:2872 stop:3111 length:240 start_codon:yes stop_codon:yes gene_type:complete